MNDAGMVRDQYDYDAETGAWTWRNAPAKAALSRAAPGMPAGSLDHRDGTLHLRFDGKAQRAGRLAWLYVTGEWPLRQVLYRDPSLPLPERDRWTNLKQAGAVEDLDQETVQALLQYDAGTGEFAWRVARKGVVAGAKAALLKNTSAKSAHLYIRIDGVDYPAQRIAWLYVHGAWPASRLEFRDNDPKNCSIGNLMESGFEHGTRGKPKIDEVERAERQRATFRRHDLKRTFDLTVDQYQVMHDAQGGRCAICGQVETATRDSKVKWLAVDHDHKTGAIRGLLCQRHNLMIGNCGDDPAILRAAADYLERHARRG